MASRWNHNHGYTPYFPNETFAMDEPPTRSSAIDVGHARAEYEKPTLMSPAGPGYSIVEHPADDGSILNLSLDETQRKLKPRHIQFIAIGGTIGMALYVQIGRGLMQGGPGSLFIAFTLWSFVVLCVNNCVAEMVSWTPISSPFVRLAGRYVDEAYGVAAGWNFFVFEAAMVPYEIVACNFIIHFWEEKESPAGIVISEKIPTAAVIVIIICLYALFNLFAVRWYGESEFWLSLGKVTLIIGLIAYTFVTMLGGNPKGDRYGFRFWDNPGVFAEWYSTGDTGRFLGFLQCLNLAAFTIAGPEYLSMAAGEAENPRQILPRAYRVVFYRLVGFFVLGALCVGIVVPYNDPDMKKGWTEGLWFGGIRSLPTTNVSASPYIVSMRHLGIRTLPHIVNALILSAAVSAGNSYAYCASRTLYGLALEGKAPKFLRKCTNNGVPIYCVTVVLVIALLSLLQVSNSSQRVLQWFIGLVTTGQLINFSIMSFTYIKFKRAMDTQGYDRSTLPYTAWCQPYCAWFAFVMTTMVAFLAGYGVFLDGQWSLTSFFFNYTMLGVVPILFLGWKMWHRTAWFRSHEIDLRMDQVEIEKYEKRYVPKIPSNIFVRYFEKALS